MVHFYITFIYFFFLNTFIFFVKEIILYYLGPPKVEQMTLHAKNISTMESPQRKFSLNGDLWRQDDKSERSVRDKIAMFSSQSNLDVPLFPNVMTAAAVTSNGKRLSKYKSSEDVCSDDKSNGQKDRSAFLVDRTQSSFDLTDSARTSTGHDSVKKYSQRTPSLSAQSALLSPITQTTRVPKTLPVVPPKVTSLSSPLSPSYDKQIFSNTTKNCAETSSNLPNAAYSSIGKTAGSYNNANNSVKTTSTPLLTRATSFSGSTLFVQDRNSPTADSTGNSQISRTTSLASTFRRPGEDVRRSSLNQLIEQRRKSISKLRGLVIPEKDTVPIDQPIVDLPEIKSRDSILLHQVRFEVIEIQYNLQYGIFCGIIFSNFFTKLILVFCDMVLAKLIINSYFEKFIFTNYIQTFFNFFAETFKMLKMTYRIFFRYQRQTFRTNGGLKVPWPATPARRASP